MISKIAQEHGVPVEKIQDEFKMGVEEEMEHAEEEMIAQEITLDHLVEDPEYYSKLDKLQLEEIYIVEEKSELTPENLEKILRDEGGASGMDPFKKAIDASEEEIKKALDKMSNVGMHEDGDYILEDDKEIIIKEEGVIDEEQEETTLDEKRKKRKKAGTWFKRKGAKGSKGGWVDCNAPDGKGGYKSCGRGSGEKRKRYPACRPTPSACKERGRGKSWGKKGSKRRKSRRNENLLRTLVREEAEKTIFGKTISEGLRFHITNDMPIRDNVYRHGTSRYFSLVNEARDLWKEGKLNLDEEDIEIMESDLGQFGSFAGQQVPLDFPMMIDESLDEAKKKKKKDPPIGKPTKNTGGGKKYKVFVRNPKTGKIKKITYGDSKGGLKGNWNNAEARKSFAARHNWSSTQRFWNERSGEILVMAAITKDDLWKAFSLIMSALVLPLAGWVWNTNVKVAELQNDLGDAEKEIAELKDEGFEGRIIGMEKDMEWMKGTLGRIEQVVTK
jgi:hypothetical protein